MPFLTDNELKQKLADMIGVDVSALPARFTGIVADANAAAYLDIVDPFVARGFTRGQVDAWDRGAEYQRDIGLFWCLLKGGGLVGYDPTLIKLLDRRGELKSVELPAQGTPQEQSGSPKVVGYGSIAFETGSQFNRDTTF